LSWISPTVMVRAVPRVAAVPTADSRPQPLLQAASVVWESGTGVSI
jgi:hypothetical protein